MTLVEETRLIEESEQKPEPSRCTLHPFRTGVPASFNPTGLRKIVLPIEATPDDTWHEVPIKKSLNPNSSRSP